MKNEAKTYHFPLYYATFISNKRNIYAFIIHDKILLRYWKYFMSCQGVLRDVVWEYV